MPQELLISPWGGLFWIIAVLVALTFHEFMHASVAYGLGDQTPKSDGRVTLFPFPHLDPLGFFLLLLFGFGWARPVRFEPTNLKFKTFGSTAVALVGPFSNGLLLVLTIAIARLVVAPSVHLQVLFQSFIAVNSLLLVFNLIPLPPFDGSKFLLDLVRGLHFDRAYGFLIKNGQYVTIGLLLIDSFIGPGLVDRLLGAVGQWASRLLIV